MNQRFAAVIVFALIVAVGASLLFYRFIASRLSAPSKPASQKVVVAAKKLDVGTLIKDSDLTVADWGATIPPQAVQKKEKLVGRGVVEPIYMGEPVLESRLAPEGAGAGLAAMIPPGMRAVAVRVNDVIGVAGFVSPGMHVDVLVSGRPPAGAPSVGTVSKTLLQNIEVLSAGKSTQRDAEGKPVSVPVINLKVTPEQAESLSLASSEARVQLVLRNPLDTEIAETPGTSVSNLYTGLKGLAKPAPPAQRVVRRAEPPRPKETPPAMIEVINGDEAKTVTVKRDSED